jgi:hypothetical protein
MHLTGKLIVIKVNGQKDVLAILKKINFLKIWSASRFPSKS